MEQKTILVVDDQAGIRTLMVEALGLAGYQVQAVASGTQALQCLERCSPHLVLLDMNMPGISGWETLRALRLARPELPVLMITADERDQWPEQGAELHISGWITKPFDLQTLYRQVQAAIN